MTDNVLAGRRYAPRYVIALLLLFVPLVLTGCSDDQIDFIIELALDWAIEKNLITVNCPPPYDADDCEFAINGREIARWKASQNRVLGGAMDIFGVDRPDPEVAAALNAGEVVYTVEQADSLAQQGLEEENVEKVDKAISMRPEDWSYHDQRAALMLSQGDGKAAQTSLNESESLVQARIDGGGDCRRLRLNMLRHREQALSTQAQRHPENGPLLDQLDRTRSQIQALEEGSEQSPCR
jgi:hypothetical protein